jgi:hypothetical protein
MVALTVYFVDFARVLHIHVYMYFSVMSTILCRNLDFFGDASFRISIMTLQKMDV